MRREETTLLEADRAYASCHRRPLPIRRNDGNRGSRSLGLLKQHQDLALHFGCYAPKERHQGHVRRNNASNGKGSYSLEAGSGEICRLGTWVVAVDKGKVHIGRISNIVPPNAEQEALVTVRVCRVGPRHPVNDMPTLRDFGDCVILPSVTVEFKIAMEHDCQYVQCEATGARHQMQERQETERVTRS